MAQFHPDIWSIIASHVSDDDLLTLNKVEPFHRYARPAQILLQRLRCKDWNLVNCPATKLKKLFTYAHEHQFRALRQKLIHFAAARQRANIRIINYVINLNDREAATILQPHFPKEDLRFPMLMCYLDLYPKTTLGLQQAVQPYLDKFVVLQVARSCLKGYAKAQNIGGMKTVLQLCTALDDVQDYAFSEIDNAYMYYAAKFMPTESWPLLRPDGAIQLMHDIMCLNIDALPKNPSEEQLDLFSDWMRHKRHFKPETVTFIINYIQSLSPAPNRSFSLLHVINVLLHDRPTDDSLEHLTTLLTLFGNRSAQCHAGTLSAIFTPNSCWTPLRTHPTIQQMLSRIATLLNNTRYNLLAVMHVLITEQPAAALQPLVSQPVIDGPWGEAIWLCLHMQRYDVLAYIPREKYRIIFWHAVLLKQWDIARQYANLPQNLEKVKHAMECQFCTELLDIFGPDLATIQWSDPDYAQAVQQWLRDTSR